MLLTDGLARLGGDCGETSKGCQRWLLHYYRSAPAAARSQRDDATEIAIKRNKNSGLGRRRCIVFCDVQLPVGSCTSQIRVSGVTGSRDLDGVWTEFGLSPLLSSFWRLFSRATVDGKFTIEIDMKIDIRIKIGLDSRLLHS
jgi:hypothetical protein